MRISDCCRNVRTLLFRIGGRQGLSETRKVATMAHLRLLSLMLLYVMMAVWALPVAAQAPNPALGPIGYHPYCVDDPDDTDPTIGWCVPSGISCDPSISIPDGLHTQCAPPGTTFDVCQFNACNAGQCTLSADTCSVDGDCPGDFCQTGDTCNNPTTQPDAGICEQGGGECTTSADCQHCNLTYGHCSVDDDCSITAAVDQPICGVTRSFCEVATSQPGSECTTHEECLGAGEECVDGDCYDASFCRPDIAVTDSCIQDVYQFYGGNQDLTCTANDIRISETSILTVIDSCQFVGDTAIVQLEADFLMTATARHDIGVYLGLDGSALTGDCLIEIVPQDHVDFSDGSGDSCDSDNECTVQY